MAEATSQDFGTVRKLHQPIWEVKVSTKQLRTLIERLIRESAPEADFALGRRPIYVWVEDGDTHPDDLSDAEELSVGCVGPAFSALVFEGPVG